MEKKEVKKYSSLWTFSNPRSLTKYFFHRTNSSRAFTLIELLIVIGIIGIMAAGLAYLINPLGQIQKANDAKRKSDLEQLQRTLELYYNDTGSYPPHSTSSNWTPGCTNNTYRVRPTTGCQEWNSTWSQYSTKIPKDPTSSRNYVYFSTGQSYYLYASLERSSDPQACSGGAACSSLSTNVPAIPSIACGSGVPICNFGVSSPNTSP